MDDTDIVRRSGKRRAITAVALLASGTLAGGIVAGTLSASASSTGTNASGTTTVASTGSASSGSAAAGPATGPMGGASPVRSDEKSVSSSVYATLKAAALKAVPGGTVYRIETDAGDGVYEAHMTKADGTRVTVKFDKNLQVTKVEAGMGTGDPRPSGNGPGAPGGYGSGSSSNSSNGTGSSSGSGGSA
jgi:hypothetical protein